MINAFALNEVALNGDRLIEGEGQAQLAFEAEGDGTIWRTSDGQAQLTLSGELTPSVERRAEGEGQVVLGGQLDALRQANAEGGSEIVITGSVEERVIPAASGFGQIRIQGTGDASVSRAVAARGRAKLSLFARARYEVRHQVYAGGIGLIALRAAEKRAGRPPIPAEYTPAHASRSFGVAAESRTFVVPRR